MPLTLTQFLFSVPVSIGALFLPILLWALVRRRTIRPLLIAYVTVSTLMVAFFFLLALLEHLNK